MDSPKCYLLFPLLLVAKPISLSHYTSIIAYLQHVWLLSFHSTFFAFSLLLFLFFFVFLSHPFQGLSVLFQKLLYMHICYIPPVNSSTWNMCTSKDNRNLICHEHFTEIYKNNYWKFSCWCCLRRFSVFEA